MITNDKNRVIGKVVAISSSRFIVELLSGLKSFSISGYDDIHYFGQVGSYVVIPLKNEHIVCEVVSVRDRDASEYTDAKEQEIGKIDSLKTLEVTPIGVVGGKSFKFGISNYPALYSDVLYIKGRELDAVFEVTDSEIHICKDCDSDDINCNNHNDKHKGKTRLTALNIGTSTALLNYEIKVKIDRFFGGHSAIFGNTGSGKTCTVSSIIQELFRKNSYAATGATFLIFDVNGEYKNAFPLGGSGEANVSHFEIDPAEEHQEAFSLPHHLFSIEEWELLLQASEKTQRPILRTALSFAQMYSKSGDDESDIDKTRDHILATCISLILRDETANASKSTRITSILSKFKTKNISLDSPIRPDGDKIMAGKSPGGSPIMVDPTIKNSLLINYGEIVGSEQLNEYLEGKTVQDREFRIPQYNKEEGFEFEYLEDALDLAILYEEAHGNRQIRDYCSSLITRYKSIREREDFSFIRDSEKCGEDNYTSKILGLSPRNGQSKTKKSQAIIFNLEGLEDELVEITVSVISRLVFDYLKRLPDRNTFPVNMVIEEAHRYISSRLRRDFLKINPIFERIAKEGRKYGLFFLVSSQRPSEMSRAVISQCNNFIVHRIQNPDDLSYIRQSTPHISEAILNKLPTIPIQHALVFGNSVNIPTLFKVGEARPRPKSDDNEVSKNWFVENDKTF